MNKLYQKKVITSRSNFEDELYERFGLECENWGETILTTRDGYQKVINEITGALEAFYNV